MDLSKPLKDQRINRGRRYISSVLLFARNRIHKLQDIDKGQKDIRIPLDGGVIRRQRLQSFGAFFNLLYFASDLLIHFYLPPSGP